LARISLASILLVAHSSCARRPTPEYTEGGLISTLPEGAVRIDLRRLPGDTMFEEQVLLVEQVQLPSPVAVRSAKGSVVLHDTAWRVTVRGEKDAFPSRALPWMIWIGDTPITAAESTDLSSLVAITFNDDLITGGGPVSVSYGSQPDQRRVIATIPRFW
jgi:hypothetical protein